MGWRFRKSIRLAPGVRLNLSKSGIGISAGVPGFRASTGPRGTRLTTGLPGTGLSYSQRLDAATASTSRTAGKGQSSSGCAVGAGLGFIALLLLLPTLLFGNGSSNTPSRPYGSESAALSRAGAPRVTLHTPTPRPTVMTVALAPAASASSSTPTPTATQTGMVNTNANLRSGPSTDAPVVGTAQAGQQVTLVGCNADCTWYELDNGAWIFAQLVTVAAAMPQPTVQSMAVSEGQGWAVVNTAILNVRAEPSTDSATIDTLAYGECVQVIASQPQWQQVRLAADQTGWCWREYLVPVAECPAVPSAPAQEATVETAAPQLPYYVGQPFVPNAAIVFDATLYECFGGGDSGLRAVAAGTPVQVLGTGPFQPPAEIGSALRESPYLKIRIWDGQYAWIAAEAVGVDLASVGQVSGMCEEYDRIDWSSVVRPTSTPTTAPVWRPTEVDSGGSRSCCRICTTGKACGNSCIARSRTCHRGPGCACDG